jgi:predicted permease
VAYLGLPVLTEIFGQQIVPQASLIISLYLIWTFSIGIFYLERTAKSDVDYKTLVSGLLKNPLLIGVFLGIIASFFKFPADGIFLKIFDIIGKSTTPVIMLSLGIFISQVTFGKWKEWINITIFSITKTMVLPALFILMLSISKMDFQTNLPSVLEAAMPFALTPYALAGVYDLDKNFITKAIVLSTIISVVTLPFWSVILK